MRGPLNLAAIQQECRIPPIAAAVMKLQRAGAEHKGRCPFHDDRSPSLTIYDEGRRFKCFGCGAQGDVIDFVQRLYGVSVSEALVMIGARQLPVIPVAHMPAAAPKEDRREEAIAIADASVPTKDTLAENYLRSRGLILPIPDSLLFARLPYGKSGPCHPVLVARVTSVDGRLTGIQRTFLNAAGTGKAAVPKPKLSLGLVRGGSVHLGPSARTLVVCEGVEDGLSLRQELGLPVWVAVGASNMITMDLPNVVKSVIIGADADPAGESAARAAAERFASQGREVRIIRPLSPHKDFNAELMAGEL